MGMSNSTKMKVGGKTKSLGENPGLAKSKELV